MDNKHQSQFFMKYTRLKDAVREYLRLEGYKAIKTQQEAREAKQKLWKLVFNG